MLEEYLKEIITCSKLTSIGLLEENVMDGQKMALTSLTSKSTIILPTINNPHCNLDSKIRTLIK